MKFSLAFICGLIAHQSEGRYLDAHGFQYDRGHSDPVSNISFTAPMSFLSGGQDGVVRKWSLADRKPQGSLVRKSYPIASMEVSLKRNLLAVSTVNGVIKVYDLFDDKGLWSKRVHDRYASTLAFSPDGRYLATGGEDGKLMIWETSGKLLLTKATAHSNAILACSFSPDGRSIATASRDKTIRLWRCDGLTNWGQLVGHRGEVRSLAFTPDGSVLLSAGLNDRYVYYWGLKPPGLLQSVQMPHQSIVCLSLMPDGFAFATAGLGTTVTVHEFASGSLLAESEVKGNPIFTLSFAPKKVMLLCGGKDGSISRHSILSCQVKNVNDLATNASLWGRICARDAAAGFSAMHTLADNPQCAIKIVRENAPFFKAPSASQLDKMFERLDDDAYVLREEATEGLERLGRDILPRLEATLKTSESLESRNRISRIIRNSTSPFSLRLVTLIRIIRLLEECNTPEANLLLLEILRGENDALGARRIELAIKRMEATKK